MHNKNFLNNQFGPNQAQQTGDGVVNTDADYDNVFNFNKKELDDITTSADLRSNGFLRFSSCGNLDVAIDPDTILNSLETLFENSQANNLIFPGDNPNETKAQPVNSTIDNSKLIPNLDQAANVLEDGLKKGINDVVNSGEIGVTVNLPNINAEIQLNILKAIPYALMQMIITPKIMIVPKLFLALKGDTSKKTPEDMLSFIKPLIQKIGAYITDLIVQNILDFT